HYQLSSTAFADHIGIARPVMSHVFSERNRPSLEVMQKIGENFPEINVSWLLYGQGEMLLAEKGKVRAELNHDQVATAEKKTVVPEVKMPDPDKVQNIRPEPKVAQPSKSVGRKAVKVLIFYSDHTFEEF